MGAPDGTFRMAVAFQTLFPLFVTLGLGYGLARLGWFSQTLNRELNRVLFYISLPALILHSLATAEAIPQGTSGIVLAFLGATLLAAILAHGMARLLGLRREQWGSFAQAAFRGNLGYTGIPVITFAVSTQPAAEAAAALAQAVFVFAPAMLLYNTLSVTVLVHSQAVEGTHTLRRAVVQVARNPLILASLLGLGIFAMPFPLPGPVLRTFQFVGQMAAPVSLLCIGAGVAYLSMKGRYRSAIVASLLKVGLVPLFALALAKLLRVEGNSLLVLMILSSCPTAAAAYIMSAELRGDMAMTAGAIILSTVLCIPGLALIMALL